MSKPNVKLNEVLNEEQQKPASKKQVVATPYTSTHKKKQSEEKALSKHKEKKIHIWQGETTPKTPIKKISEPPSPFPFLDYKGLRDYGKIRLFIDWCAISIDDKKPKTQREFAELIGVNADTLSDWKKRRGFFDEVDERRDQWFRKYVTDMDYAMVKAGLGGNPKAAELFYKRYGYLVEKSVIEHVGDYDEKMDAVTRTALTNIGLAGVLKELERDKN